MKKHYIVHLNEYVKTRYRVTADNEAEALEKATIGDCEPGIQIVDHIDPLFGEYTVEEMKNERQR